MNIHLHHIHLHSKEEADQVVTALHMEEAATEGIGTKHTRKLTLTLVHNGRRMIAYPLQSESAVPRSD